MVSIVELDRERNLAYILLRPELRDQPGGVARSVRVAEDVVLDLDANGQLIGIEFLNASSRLDLSSVGKVGVKEASEMKKTYNIAVSTPPTMKSAAIPQGVRYIAAGLVEGCGVKSEYARGVCELLAQLYPRQYIYTPDRAVEIAVALELGPLEAIRRAWYGPGGSAAGGSRPPRPRRPRSSRRRGGSASSPKRRRRGRGTRITGARPASVPLSAPPRAAAESAAAAEAW